MAPRPRHCIFLYHPLKISATDTTNPCILETTLANLLRRTMAQLETDFILQRVICAVPRSDCGFVFLSALVCNSFAKSGCCDKLSMVGHDLSPHPVSGNISPAKYIFSRGLCGPERSLGLSQKCIPLYKSSSSQSC